MGSRAAITVNRSREEVERLWRGAEHEQLADAAVTFKDAPGARGTEIHAQGGRLREGGAQAMRAGAAGSR